MYVGLRENMRVEDINLGEISLYLLLSHQKKKKKKSCHLQ